MTNNADTTPALEVVDIIKTFGPVLALRGVSLSVNPGEVLGIVGDNGAGKSTLISIISGVVRPDSGVIRINGEEWKGSDARGIRRAGIETVFQNLALAPTLNIVENMYLGRELYGPGPLGRTCRHIDKPRMRREATKAFEQLGVKLPPITSKVGSLSGGQRQAVAVARAVLWGGRVVIMDEPTAALGVQQTEAILALIEALKRQGIATILISHNMPQVLQVSDRIAVMRLGEKVADLDLHRESVSPTDLVALLTGATAAA